MKRFAASVSGLLLLVLLVSGAMGAQRPFDEILLTGLVLHADTGAPIAAAQVSLLGTVHGAVTDPSGRYEIRLSREGLPARGAVLRVQRLGFQPVEVAVRTESALVSTDIRLQPAFLALQEIVATGVVLPVEGVRSPIAVAPSAMDLQGRVSNLPPPPDWNREQYDFIAENRFLAAAGSPLSTFSIDVDRASYSNIRRFLADGVLPPVDAVRIEEMVNYFPYDYARPRGADPFAVTTEVGPAPWRAGHLLLRIGLASAPVETAELPPSNLVFLLDVSGSMNSPDKLPLVQRSLRLLVNELRPEDRVAIVVYAGAAGLVLPSTPGSDKERILDAIERLTAGGSTAGGAGLALAYAVAREYHLPGGNNRIILATDGDFNVGPSSDSEMTRLVEERRAQGTHLTVLGFGTGNLQSEKMQKLAQHGNGNYAYIDSFLEARKVLVEEMGGTLLTVAQDVKIQVEFNPEQVQAYRLIGYENRLLAAEDFNNDARDAGEMGAGHTVTAIYEVVPVGVETDVEVGGTDPLRYRNPEASLGTTGSGEWAFVRVRYKAPGEEESRLLEHPVPGTLGAASNELRFASAVAGFGMLLRESEHRGDVTAEQILALARGSLGRDPDGYRADFVRLVERYRSVVSGEFFERADGGTR